MRFKYALKFIVWNHYFLIFSGGSNGNIGKGGIKTNIPVTKKPSQESRSLQLQLCFVYGHCLMSFWGRMSCQWDFYGVKS